MGLEINLISFIPIIIRKNKYRSEAALKYFLIQVTASIFILIRVLLINKFYIIKNIVLIRLILKIAVAPLHKWLPAIIQGLSWNVITFILVFQKLAPFVTLIILNLTFKNFYIFYLFIILRALVGGLRGLIHASLRKIIAYSSISHIAWLLISMLVSNNIFIKYFLGYSLILITVITVIKHLIINSISDILTININKLKILLCLNLLSLAGLPPFSGFIIKFILIFNTIFYKELFLLIPLIISSLFNLFFYMRLIYRGIVLYEKTNKNINFKGQNTLLLKFTNVLALFFGVFLIQLDFKLL